MEEVATPEHDDDRERWRNSSASTETQTAKAVFFEGAIRQVRLRGHPRRPRRQRDEAAESGRRNRYRPGHRRGDHGASAPSQATARRSG